MPEANLAQQCKYNKPEHGYTLQTWLISGGNVEGYLQSGVNTTLDVAVAAETNLDEIADMTSLQIFKQTLCAACPLLITGECNPGQYQLGKSDVVIIPKIAPKFASKVVKFSKPPTNPQQLKRRHYAALPLGV